MPSGATIEVGRTAPALRTWSNKRDDFRAADVKKLVGPNHGKFYRAKLDGSNRLLFALVRQGTEVCAVLLEVIENHAYARSRFLRGAAIDEDKIPVIATAPAPEEAQSVRYLHPQRREILYLDKPLSLDDVQHEIYRAAPPLVLIGGAGSGKTALTLEKLKEVDGDVLYVTHSSYLAQNARDLYYAHGFERDGQDAAFFSYREFLESLRVPPGREVAWRDFAAWFARVRDGFRDVDAHQAFEEMRGVIAAEPRGEKWRNFSHARRLLPATKMPVERGRSLLGRYFGIRCPRGSPEFLRSSDRRRPSNRSRIFFSAMS